MSGRCKHHTWLAVTFLILIALWHLDGDVSVGTDTLDASQELASRTATESAGQRVLLLSSVGRSGSTFLGELLSQRPGTLYLFEPELYLQRKTSEGVNAASSTRLLSELFSCGVREAWAEWAATYPGGVRTANGTKLCKDRKAESYWGCFTRVCRQHQHKVIKVIKLRLQWIADLLEESVRAQGDQAQGQVVVGQEVEGQGQLEGHIPRLKVVHLVRDPRPTFLSLTKRRMLQSDYTEWCPKILKDLESVKELQKRYPTGLISIRYEDLCDNTNETATKLWRFLSEDSQASIPESWATYLAQHTSHQTRNAFGTLRNSQEVVQAWRTSIPEHLLRDIEKYCGEIIRHLGYTMFGSIKNARNLSIPLRVDVK